MNRALRVCTAPGCRTLTTAGRCQQHRRLRSRDSRPSAAARGYDAAWRRRRRVWLESHPLCAACESRGRIRLAVDVDHVVPHRGDPILFDGPVQSLCRSCHSRKTGRGE